MMPEQERKAGAAQMKTEGGLRLEAQYRAQQLSLGTGFQIRVAEKEMRCRRWPKGEYWGTQIPGLAL